MKMLRYPLFFIFYPHIAILKFFSQFPSFLPHLLPELEIKGQSVRDYYLATSLSGYPESFIKPYSLDSLCKILNFNPKHLIINAPRP
jgi:hypothetical protein